MRTDKKNLFQIRLIRQIRAIRVEKEFRPRITPMYANGCNSLTFLFASFRVIRGQKKKPDATSTTYISRVAPLRHAFFERGFSGLGGFGRIRKISFRSDLIRPIRVQKRSYLPRSLQRSPISDFITRTNNDPTQSVSRPSRR